MNISRTLYYKPMPTQTPNDIANPLLNWSVCVCVALTQPEFLKTGLGNLKCAENNSCETHATYTNTELKLETGQNTNTGIKCIILTVRKKRNSVVNDTQ